MIPQDPIMLRSFVNTKLRDQYKDLEDLCEDLELEKEDILKKLKETGFEYDEIHRQFI